MCDPVTATVALEASAAASAAIPAAMGVFATAGASTAASVAGASASAGGLFSGMTGMEMLSGGMSLANGIIGGQAKEDQANYEASVARNNQLTAQYASDDAKRRGELEAQRVQRQTSQLAGSQRASFAARGLDITEGTPGDIMDQTNFFGQIDANTARYNGKVEAWQKQSQAANYGAQAASASARASSGLLGGMLSGAGSVAERWAVYGKRG